MRWTLPLAFALLLACSDPSSPLDGGVALDAATDAAIPDTGVDAGSCPAGDVCDDGDACTEQDRCDLSGACVGTPRTCDAPAPAECIGDVLRSYGAGECSAGDCQYVPSDLSCDHGCELVEGVAACVVPSFVWEQVATGSSHTCIRHRDGTLMCWGDNDQGQLGVGEFGGRRTAPANVPGVSDARFVAAGGYHSCAIVGDGAVACWGSGSSGQLGDGLMTRSATPVLATGIDDAVDLCTGTRYTCVVRADESVWCWGFKSNGLLIAEPEAIEGLSEVVDVECHGQFQCALRADGEVLCWGYGPNGELGYDSFGTTRTPTRAGDITDASAIFTGIRQSCAVRPSGFACWGFNESGQLGRGSAEPADDYTPMGTLFGTATNPPVAMGGSFHSTCVLLADGTAQCVGQNGSGQLGNRSDSDSLTPVEVYGLRGARQLASGNGHVCALVDDALWCWGQNYYGQLGRGDRDDSLEPVEALLP